MRPWWILTLPYAATIEIERLRGALDPESLFRSVLRRIMGILDAIFLGDNWEDLESFRRSGELNKWLYDYFSLTLLLQKTGFCDVSRKTYRTSDIPDWNRDRKSVV